MNVVEGIRYEEMRDVLGTAVGGVEMRVHRAGEGLQVLLVEKYAWGVTTFILQTVVPRTVASARVASAKPLPSAIAKCRSIVAGRLPPCTPGSMASCPRPKSAVATRSATSNSGRGLPSSRR